MSTSAAVRELDADEIARSHGPTEYLRALVRDGPAAYVENASITMRALGVDDKVVPLVIAEPGRGCTYVCSPHSHFVGYPLSERGKRASALAMLGYRALLGPYGSLLRACRIDRVVYVDNWLLSTNPTTPLTADQITRITEYLRERYPRHAIVHRTVNPALDPQRHAYLRAAGYRMIKSRRVYLFDPRADGVFRRHDVWKDRKLLRRTLHAVTRANGADAAEASRLNRLYRHLYLDYHCRLNPVYTERFFALLLRDPFFSMFLWRRDEHCDAFSGLFVTNGHLVGMLTGYDRLQSRRDGLYRQVVAHQLVEAQRTGLMLNMSGGAGEFKCLRGAVETVEFDAVYDRHLPAWRRFAWRLVQWQGALWRMM